ncbi:MAG: hypothetical protein SV760_00385, partial [Halobacteria archaeon]|nr:hypothetical protein [Halobacteria archaeon]
KDLFGASSDDGAETWLPYQSELRGVTVLGLTVGALGGYVAYVTQSAFLAFGISAATLVFINAGVRRVPVTHHITLPASTAVLAAGVTSNLAAVVVVGALFGALGSVAGELLQRLLYAHSETHLDPPAASIVVTSFVIAVLGLAGVFKGFVWIPHP